MASLTGREKSRIKARLDRRADRLIKGVDDAVRATALLADQTVVLATPVDTGRARMNWIATIDVPAEEPVPINPGGVERSLAESRAVIATYNGEVNRAIWLTNSLPYIQRLNAGSSQQAPAGFVEKAVGVARGEFTRIDVGLK